MTLELQTCSNCGTTVVPRSDGCCPSCQTKIAASRGDHPSARVPGEPSLEQQKIETKVRQLADRSFNRGLWSLLLSLTVVLIPVAWILAFSACNAQQDAKVLTRTTGHGTQFMAKANWGAYMAGIPLAGLLLVFAARFFVG